MAHRTLPASFISTFTSGIIQRSTTSAAVAPCIATKPESRPMSFTMPTPAVEAGWYPFLGQRLQFANWKKAIEMVNLRIKTYCDCP